MYRIYISPSVQDKNTGYGSYGTEEFRMNLIADSVIKYLDVQNGKFLCKRNNPSWGMSQVTSDSNSFGACRHLAIHSDASVNITADGTTTYYAEGYEDSKRYAAALQNAVAPLSPGSDQGVKSDLTLYDTGLGELRGVKTTTALIEVGYHTNPADAASIVDNARAYGKALAKATVEDCGEVFIDPDIINIVVPSGPADVGAALILSRALQVRMAYRGDILSDENALQVGGGEEVQPGCLKIIGDDFIDTAEKALQYAKIWRRI